MHARDTHHPSALVLALLLTAPALADGDGAWQPEDSLQQRRQETGAARIGDFVYVVGGLVQGFQAIATVERLDLVNGGWTFVKSLPVALDHMGVAAYGGKLYVVGGYSGDFQARDEVWIYDPQLDDWSPGAPMPQGRGAHWAVTHLDRIYVFGGDNPNGASTRTTFIYDPLNDSWTTGALMPTAREHLNAVSLGDRIYVIGGRAGAASKANEAYDPAADDWNVLAPMPTARSAGAVAAFGGRVYYMGGEVPVLHAVNESYDPVSNTWDSGPPMPLPRHGVAAVTLEDRILLAAGGVIQGLNPTEQADSFVPEPCPGWIVFCSCGSDAACSNADALAGCANSTGVGSRMFAAGTTSVSADDLVLSADGIPANQFGIYFMGPGLVRVPFGDGLRCVGDGGVGLFRYPARAAGGTGTLVEGPGIAGFSMNFGPSGSIAPGSTWSFQCWYRDPMGPCGTTSNASQAIAITFGL